MNRIKKPPVSQRFNPSASPRGQIKGCPFREYSSEIRLLIRTRVERAALDLPPRASAWAGFSLIEILVVIFIIVLLSGIILANYRSGQEKYALSRAASQVISDIRTAQNMAMATQRYEDEFVCGWGIHYQNQNNQTYLLYTRKINGACGSRNYQPSDSTVKTLTLPEQIEFASSFDDIFFEPPDPKTYINNETTQDSTIYSTSITLKIKNKTCPEHCQSIQVKSSGLIE